MATRNQYDATRQELSDTWQPISGAFNFTYTSLAGFPRLLLHHDGSLYVLAAAGSIMWLRPEYQINDGAWDDAGWGADGLKRTFPNGFDGTIPMQCNRPCFPGVYPAGTTVRTRMMAKCSGSVVLCDSDLIPQTEAVKTWTQSESHQWNEAEDDINPVQDIVFVSELVNIGTPEGTGDIWGEVNSNRHFLAIEGNRFVWAGARRPGGEYPLAQTVVGYISDNGQITYGALSEDTLDVNALSLSTHGVCGIGNNKFARYITSNNGFGFAVWDCGVSGLSATLIVNNYNNGVNTLLPTNSRDCVLHSNGKMYVMSGTYSPGYNKCRMQVCNISNSSGVTSSIVNIDEIFGINRDFYYIEGEQGVMQGKPILAGGAMWVVKTADSSDSSSNPKMEIITSNGSSVNRYQCSDNDGYPLALSVASDGVFSLAYLTTDSKIRVRVGKLTGLTPTFGSAFDIYGASAGQQIFFADMEDMGNGKFGLAIQNDDTSKQDYIVFETDGAIVTCGDTYGAAIASLSKGNGPIMLCKSGYDKKMLVGNYGGSGTVFTESGSRYTSMIGIAGDPVAIQSASPVSASVLLREMKYFAIKSSAIHTSLSVTLTDLTADIDLYVRAGGRPSFAVKDGYSENTGTSNEVVTVANAGETVWYIGVYGYEAGSATLTATLS